MRMGPIDPIMIELTKLLEDSPIGLTYLIPRPGGGSLTGEVAQAVERALAALEGFACIPGPVYGNGCFAVARYADAAEVYRRILMRSPGDPVARFNLGVAYVRLKMFREAADEFTTLLEQEPFLAEAHYQRGNAYDDLGKPDAALEDYARAIRLNPGYLQALYNQGIVLSRLGRHTEALDAFDQVITLRPELSNAYLNRGASLDEDGAT